MNGRRVFLLVFVACLLGACGLRQSNFSQYPGFDRWYQLNPPRTELPNASERRLLARYRPRLFVASDSSAPIRFYEDYIAYGVLYDANGKVISNQVDSELLNRYRDDPRVVFAHMPVAQSMTSAASGQPQAIARISYETFPAQGALAARDLLFLDYYFVFARSGVAAGVRPWQRLLLRAIANLDDWHQLDHYTSVSIALDAQSHKPLAVILQQHNYMRTWLISDRTGPGRLQLPNDRRIKVVAARGSNELYLWRAGRQFRRAVPMLTADNVSWLVMGRDRPLVSADDITEPQHEPDYALRMLPSSDAFFVFKGWLGERRRFPGRDGPPGADYNTIPLLKARVTQLGVFWWHDGARDYVDIFRAGFSKERFAPLMQRFARALDRQRN